MKSHAILCAMALTMSTIASGQEPAVRLYPAGSLRAAMTEVAQAFSATGWRGFCAGIGGNSAAHLRDDASALRGERDRKCHALASVRCRKRSSWYTSLFVKPRRKRFWTATAQSRTFG